MKHSEMTSLEITKSLKDCGCPQELIERFLSLDEKEQLHNRIRLLNIFRKELMDHLHDAQIKIDRLDFIIHELEKEDESADNNS